MFTKTIISILLTLMILSTATMAYSLWRDELKAVVKVSTGELNLKFICHKIIACQHCSHNHPEEYYHSGEIISNGKKFVGKFENVYPCWKAIVALVIKNVGTVPATLNNINVKLHGDQELINTFHYRVCVFGPLGKSLSETPYWTRPSYEDLKELISICRNKVVLDPGEKAIVIIPMGIRETFVNSSNFNMEVTFDFVASW